MPLPDFFSPSVLVQPVTHSAFSEAELQVSVIRLDLLHPQLSGNKWFKLKYNLETALQQGSQTLVSFGGAWSNHLHALAWAGKEVGISTVGFVRGELPDVLNPCMQDCSDWGMTLLPLNRENYRRRYDDDYVATLIQNLPTPYVLPEGGANFLGIKGCADIVDNLNQQDFDQLILACGTGTTLAGLLMRCTVPVMGIQVLKGQGYLQKEVQQLLSTYDISPQADWKVRDDFHQGGYAKVNAELLSFCGSFEVETGVPLEPVYSGKLMMAVLQLAQKGYFSLGARLGVIHGGGMQGRRGYFNNIK